MVTPRAPKWSAPGLSVILLVTTLTGSGLPSIAADVSVQAGKVSICLSPPPDGIPSWGVGYAYLLIANTGKDTVSVLDPDFACDSCVGPCPDPRIRHRRSPRGWNRVEAGGQRLQGWSIAPPGHASQALPGDHRISVSLELDLDGDYKGDVPIRIEATYRILEPPAAVLTLAHKHGEEVELCRNDGTKLKAVTIPWGALETEKQAAVRDRIALPAPPMSPEESAKRMGRPPAPKDPEDRKRLEEALRTDPEYQEWTKLKASLGRFPYSLVDYESTVGEIRSAVVGHWGTDSQYFQATYVTRLDVMEALNAGPAYRIQRALRLILEQGKPAALAHLDAIAKEQLRCVDRAFLEEVRAIVVSAPDNLSYEEVVWKDAGE